MTLVLKQQRDITGEIHSVDTRLIAYSGRASIGIIDRVREGFPNAGTYTWGLSLPIPDGLPARGSSATLEGAQQMMRQRWAAWLAFANLREGD